MKLHSVNRSEPSMTQEEKNRVLTLLSSKSRWCQDAEARDHRGEDVRFDDAAAVAWDLTGAFCHLFGWERAMDLFPQLAHHLTGRRPTFGRHRGQPRGLQMASMIVLQDYNDQPNTGYESVMARLATVPVCQPGTAGVLTITSNASLCLAAALAEKQAGENMALRMVQNGDDWSLWLDHIQPDDVSFAHEGKTVLVLGSEASASLCTSVLDVEETPGGPVLSLRAETACSDN
jgi:hypothetical protein